MSRIRNILDSRKELRLVWGQCFVQTDVSLLLYWAVPEQLLYCKCFVRTDQTTCFWIKILGRGKKTLNEVLLKRSYSRVNEADDVVLTYDSFELLRIVTSVFLEIFVRCVWNNVFHIFIVDLLHLEYTRFTINFLFFDTVVDQRIISHFECIRVCY